MKVILILGIFQLHSISCKDSSSNSTAPKDVHPLGANFTQIFSTKDLSASPSDRKSKRQSGRQSSKNKSPKVKSYSDANGYVQVYESEPQSYSTSYHHNSEEPTQVYSNSKKSSKGNVPKSSGSSKSNKNADSYSDIENNDYSNNNNRNTNSNSNRNRYTTGNDDYDDTSNNGRSSSRPSNNRRNANDDSREKAGEVDFDEDYEKERKRHERFGVQGERNYNEYDDNFPEGNNNHNRRSSTRNRDRDQDDFYLGQDEGSDGYGQSGQRTTNSRPTARGRGREDDFLQDYERDYDENNRDSNSNSNRRSNNNGSRRSQNRRRDEEYDFDFNEEDPFGEQEARASRRGDRSRNIYSSTI